MLVLRRVVFQSAAKRRFGGGILIQQIDAAGAAGRIEVNGVTLNARDGAAATDEAMLRITALEDAEIVLVDAA